MSVSTDGQICFGVLLKDDVDLPWGDDGSVGEWWERIKGYVSTPQLFDEHGEYLNGVKPADEQVKAWLAHRNRWNEENRLPVDIVNVCSADYPQYILAVPGTFAAASRGYPKKIGDINLQEAPNCDALLAFCKEYGIDVAEPPT